MDPTARGWQARRRTTRGSVARIARAGGAGPRRRAALALALLLATGGSCGADDVTQAGASVDDEAPNRQVSVTTRDGVVTTAFPTDLLTHVFEHAVAGTSADGGFRLYVEHRPDDKLIRVSGVTKDALTARGWVIEAEHHFETAIEIRSAKGKGPSHTTRVTWFVARAGRILLCEGIARDGQRVRLDEPLKQRCQHLEVKPVEGPAPVPPSGG